jgi:hypothetical protein
MFALIGSDEIHPYPQAPKKILYRYNSDRESDFKKTVKVDGSVAEYRESLKVFCEENAFFLIPDGEVRFYTVKSDLSVESYDLSLLEVSPPDDKKDVSVLFGIDGEFATNTIEVSFRLKFDKPDLQDLVALRLKNYCGSDIDREATRDLQRRIEESDFDFDGDESLENFFFTLVACPIFLSSEVFSHWEKFPLATRGKAFIECVSHSRCGGELSRDRKIFESFVEIYGDEGVQALLLGKVSSKDLFHLLYSSRSLPRSTKVQLYTHYIDLRLSDHFSYPCEIGLFELPHDTVMEEAIVRAHYIDSGFTFLVNLLRFPDGEHRTPRSEKVARYRAALRKLAFEDYLVNFGSDHQTQLIYFIKIFPRKMLSKAVVRTVEKNADPRNKIYLLPCELDDRAWEIIDRSPVYREIYSDVAKAIER